MPILRTERLVIRPLEPADLDACHRLYSDIAWYDAARSNAENRERKRSWIAWSAASQRELPRLHQPPLVDNAVVDGRSGAFVGLAGLVTTLEPFGVLPSFGGDPLAMNTLEVGLFWAISPSRHREGLATEAAGALVAFGFGELGLARIVATTEHANAASIGVMRRLGMTVERNPHPMPVHFQTVGRLDAGAQS
jgi:RimJ/RimL family protein N-acetyltransferase